MYWKSWGVCRGLVLVLAAGALAACGGDASAPPPVEAVGQQRGGLAACPAGVGSGDIQPGTASAPLCDSTQYTLFSNVAYASGGSQRLDLYVPKAGTAPFKTVIWIHGGGWQSGDKVNVNQAKRLVCRGYALASINYRLSGEAKFPAQIHDVKAAIRFLRANAAGYGLDAQRFALFGSSAGGHLAALGGTGGGVADLEDLAMGNAGVSSRVQAVVDWYGPTDFKQMDTQLRDQGCSSGGHSSAGSAESLLLGCAVGDAACASAVARANPVTYVSAGDPPTLLMHGTADCVVPKGQSELLRDALGAVGTCNAFRSVLGAGHGTSHWHTAEVQDPVAAFLDAVLASPAAPSPVEADCSKFTVSGDARSTQGATWRYDSIDSGVHYMLEGVLFVPSIPGPFPGVVINHGKGGTPRSYSANVARSMVGWGLVAIGIMLTHAPDAEDLGNLPDGADGASPENVRRAHKARDLLSCVGSLGFGGVDMTRVAVHGHSMGAFVTGQLLGTHPQDFRAASHTAGGVSTGVNATKREAAEQIVTPYQLHHGDADTVVHISQDRTLDGILTTSGVPHELWEYAGYTHEQMALDATMLSRVRTWYRTHGVLP